MLLKRLLVKTNSSIFNFITTFNLNVDFSMLNFNSYLNTDNIDSNTDINLIPKLNI